MSTTTPRYVVVSPVKDEQKHIELTLHSVIAQTVQPIRWVIVDDGSSDRSAEIVDGYLEKHSFIHLLRSKDSGPRQPGSAVIRAFQRGCADLKDLDYDFIVKLDCDLSFPPDYFAQLFREFAADHRLGIASGVYSEQLPDASWKTISMPSYHAFGASKVLRRTCYDDIGGFVAAPGWDTLDQIRALSRGWRTCHFPHLIVRHHKPEGSAIGVLRTSRMHGEIFYTTGGDPILLLPKALRRLTERPLLLNGLALVTGYCAALLRRQPRLVTPIERRCYRRMLRRRVLGLRPITIPDEPLAEGTQASKVAREKRQ